MAANACEDEDAGAHATSTRSARVEGQYCPRAVGRNVRPLHRVYCSIAGAKRQREGFSR